MYYSVTKVLPLENFLLEITFMNGEVRIFDMNPCLNIGGYRVLSDLEQFKRVHVSFDAIEWDSGIDIDPEYLYHNSDPIPIF